ncbi:hypothetical protein BX666DRAFT_1905305 [Dichotomocladium elegans]|nr:hypothetical protein BX666DRAFT_1905305 [Dichotomocladium elegans]
MRQFTKASTIDIRLNEEKFYFPGQTIEGNVLLHLQKPAKTNCIRISFSGDMQIAIKDKETINLFQKTEILPVSPNSNGKAQILDAKQHTFPFTFVVPENLPSSLELGKRKAHIRYKLTAIHDRPMVPETLSAKADYYVQILEYIDVESPEYNQPKEQALDFVLPTGRQQCQLKTSMPRFGYTRGDLVKLKILLTHYERFVKEGAIRVDLIRAVDIRTPRNSLGKEEVLKSINHNVNIIGPYNFSQDFHSQLPIPTSTPPSIRYRDKVIDIYYKIRIRLFMSHTKKDEWQQQLELPIVVGTWPKASVPIDDDDDEVDVPIGLSDEDEDEDEDDRHSVASVSPIKMTTSRSSTTLLQQQQYQVPQHRRNPSASLRSAPSASAVTLSTSKHLQQNSAVMRSDSNASRSSQKSRNSQASWRSSQSWEPHASPTLSRNTSAGTAITYPEITLHNGPIGNTNGGTVQQSFFNRSSSTPDLLAQQQHCSTQYEQQQQQQQQQQQYYQHYPQQQISRPSSGPYYPYMTSHVTQPITQNNNASNTTNYQGRPSSITTGGPSSGIYRQQQYSPSGSNPARMPVPNRSYPYTDEWDDQQQHQHQQRQQQPYPYPYPQHSFHHQQQQQQQPYRMSEEAVSSDDSDDSDDDGDLLRIIEKKKKREKRAAQATVAAITEGINSMYKY